MGPFEREFLPYYQQWINDFEVTRYFLSWLGPRMREEREAWYARLSQGDATGVDFLMYERATMRPIGYTTLEDIDYFHRCANYGILIGEKDCWNKGYGTEATRLMLAYAFRTLHLHNVMLKVDSGNERAIRAYVRAGFREIGRRREVRWVDGVIMDQVFMDCLATDFASNPPSIS